MIDGLEEQMLVKSGLNLNQVNKKQEPLTKWWIDKMKDMMRSRNISMHSTFNKELKITSNGIISKHARDYAQMQSNKIEILKLINNTRICKQLFLHCELVSCSGRE